MTMPRAGWIFTAAPLPDPLPGVLALRAGISGDAERLAWELNDLCDTAHAYRVRLLTRGADLPERDRACIVRALEMTELRIVAIHREVMPELIPRRMGGAHGAR